MQLQFCFQILVTKILKIDDQHFLTIFQMFRKSNLRPEYNL